MLNKEFYFYFVFCLVVFTHPPGPFMSRTTEAEKRAGFLPTPSRWKFAHT
jgi:hypothetical protein